MFAMTKLTGIFGPKMASEAISQRLILAVVCLQHLRLWPHHFHIAYYGFIQYVLIQVTKTTFGTKDTHKMF